MSRIAGGDAESKAANYLTSKGYRVVVRNFLVKFGEIDLVCEVGDLLVFVEVKMRKSSSHGYGREYVTPKKLQKLIRTAELYRLATKNENTPYRIDVVEIQGDMITHLENVTM